MFNTYMKNIRIFDSISGDLIENGLIVMEHKLESFGTDSITYIGKHDNYQDSIKVNNQDNILDLSGHTIIPGIINSYTMLYVPSPVNSKINEAYKGLISFRRSAEALYTGITTLACIDNHLSIGCSLKSAINKHMFMGPEILVSKNILNLFDTKKNTKIGTFKDYSIELIDLLEKKLNDLDFVFISTVNLQIENKLLNGDLFEKVISDIISLAHTNGKKVIGLFNNNKEIKTAVNNGIDCIVNTCLLDDKTIDNFIENDVYLISNLSENISQKIINRYINFNGEFINIRTNYREKKQSILKAINKGIKISLGTGLISSDQIGNTTTAIKEIELLTEAGMSPKDAIKAATHNSAELLGLDDKIGSLKTGKSGDFIVCKGKPDKSISDLRNLKIVAKDCRLVFSETDNLKSYRFNISGPGPSVGGGIFMDW